MYEALLEFLEGWGGARKNPFRGGGMDIFWNYTLEKYGYIEFYVLFYRFTHLAASSLFSNTV